MPNKINRSQRLFIELGTSLTIRSSSEKVSVTGELIGMQVGKYLIIRIETVNPPTGFYKKNEVLTVKYTNIGDIFSFASQVIQTIDLPEKLIFIEYPHSAKSCSVRSCQRTNCFLPVLLSSEARSVNGTIINITTVGCLCVIDNLLSPHPEEHAPVTIQFSYAKNKVLSIEGEVRTVQKQSLNSSFGIKFFNMDDHSRNILKKLIPALAL